jgi:uncharacterized small protein (DUF1192 family)
VSAQATIAVALLGSGALTALITWLVSRRQTEATMASVLVEASKTVVSEMRTANAEMREALDDMKARLAVQGEEIARLTAETAACHRDRDVDRIRIGTLERELARYKAGPDATYEGP